MEAINLLSSNARCMSEMRDFFKANLGILNPIKAEEAIIICHELIGNCKKHGKGEEIYLKLDSKDQTTLLEVTSLGYQRNEALLKKKIMEAQLYAKEKRFPSEEDECGRGLMIVASIAKKLDFNEGKLKIEF